MRRSNILFPNLFALVILGGLALAPAEVAVADDANGSGILCDQKYALCTSAPCIPDPKDPARNAICECTVHQGVSFGMKACEVRAAKERGGVTVVASTYSLAEYRTKGTMTCPSGAPWTYCLDKPCTIDPMNPLRAICACSIEDPAEFVTLGGDCDTLSCTTGFWSGATPADVAAGEATLVKALGLKERPANGCYLGSSN